MKKTIFIFIILALIGLGAYTYLKIDPKATDESLNAQIAKYSDSSLGLEFEYPSGPQGYVVEERTPTNKSGTHLRAIVLIQSDNVDQAPDGGEGLPTITINVFKNTQKQSPQAWADINTVFSNMNLKLGEVTEETVGGANAIRYMADGLYASDNAVITHGENVYVVSGMFLDEDSNIRKDYEPILDSIRFIPTPGQG